MQSFTRHDRTVFSRTLLRPGVHRIAARQEMGRHPHDEKDEDLNEDKHKNYFAAGEEDEIETGTEEDFENTENKRDNEGEGLDRQDKDVNAKLNGDEIGRRIYCANEPDNQQLN